MEGRIQQYKNVGITPYLPLRTWAVFLYDAIK